MICYEKSNGKKIELDKWPVVLEDITDIFGKSWSYEVSENKLRNRSKLNKFYRTSVQKKITLQIFCDSESEYCEIVNNISEITDEDILSKAEGKLWYGDYYLPCYITGLAPKDYDDVFYTIDIDATLVSFYPFWINKHTYEFHSYNQVTTNNKRYPGRYPYRYTTGQNSNYFINPHFTDSNFRLIIYGKVTNPQVSIGEASYRANVILEEGERLEIDSRTETITKIMRNGEEVNAFHSREKSRTFFRKIKPGRNTVSWPGGFDFDLIIFEERTEPKWIPLKS